MIRITLLSQSKEEAVLKVEGWLKAQFVDMLEKEGNDLRQQTQQLVLNVKGLHFVDPKGLELLKRWTSEGVILRSEPSPYRIMLECRGLTVELIEE